MSELREALDEYLAIRRALGFKLVEPGRLLYKFVFFAEQKGASFITTDLAVEWATQPIGVQPVQWAHRFRMVRLFAQYRSGADPRTEIPPLGLLPRSYHRKPPRLFSEEEITRLLDAAQRLPSPSGLQAATYSTLFGLLAVSGMRVCESITLDREHVDLTRGVLLVRNSKFGKSRLVPIHPTTQDALHQYACLRDQIYPKPKTPAFFMSERGVRLDYSRVYWVFLTLSRQIGLRGPRGTPSPRGHSPRLHDFRHKFAIETLLEWYRSGVDVQRHIPELAAYLGHRHVTDTYWYLSATPELLRLAMLRVDEMEDSHYEDLR